jgi:Flp pilus assembly secretin CpaC
MNALRIGLAAAALMLTGAASAETSGTVDVIIDFAKVLRLQEPAQTIIIGNPGIADASIDSEQTLILTGKTAGTTNLIVLNKDGGELLNTTLRVSSDTHQLTTVFLGANRQTYSCAPVCEQVVSVGDENNRFDQAATQIQTREQLSK